MISQSQSNPNQAKRCPYCHHVHQVVWVHGHGQCSVCRINIEPCCSGAACDYPQAIDEETEKEE